jgi:hypothetical protein
MAVNEIADRREDGQPLEKIAHVVRSLKTPDEVRCYVTFIGQDSS